MFLQPYVSIGLQDFFLCRAGEGRLQTEAARVFVKMHKSIFLYRYGYIDILVSISQYRFVQYDEFLIDIFIRIFFVQYDENFFEIYA